MPAPLVTMDAAKQHLNVFVADHDADIQMKLEAASDLVLKIVSTRIPEEVDGVAVVPPVAWTAATAPPPVKQAVLRVLSYLFEHRGDDLAAGTDFEPRIRDLLWMYRDPVVR